MNKLIRRLILQLLFFLPVNKRADASRWLRGRDELKKLGNADYVFVTCPKSGRTWLRIMLSRILQKQNGLPETEIIGSSSFNRHNPALPAVFFTHDSYIGNYTGNKSTKSDYLGKHIVLLVRDPRDIAISAYFQWKYRMDEQKRSLHAASFESDDLSIFQFAMHPEGSLRRTIDLMNGWNTAMHQFDHFLVVRYEDIKEAPVQWLQRIVEFCDLNVSHEELTDAVEHASMDNMKKMERESTFGTKSRRFSSGTHSSNNAYKVRRGKVGGYADYFSPEECRQIDELIKNSLAPEYGY